MSLRQALPMLFASFCTWIANDLNDRDRDRINHPDRPLPSGGITPQAAAILFFISLALALSTTYLFVERAIAFWYYLVIILALSYGYVVELGPVLKAPYVAAAMTIPILVTAKSYSDPRLFQVAAAVFCFALGKEACMDLLDRRGDTPSALHGIAFHVVARVAFAFLVAGLFFLAIGVTTTLDSLYLTGMAAMLSAASLLWFRWRRHRPAIRLLRVTVLAGLYFLL